MIKPRAASKSGYNVLVGSIFALSAVILFAIVRFENGATPTTNTAAQQGEPTDAVIASPASPPYVPTAADVQAYNDARLKLIMALAECKLSKALTGVALEQGDQVTAYKQAVEGKTNCENLSSLDVVDFSKIADPDLAAKLKDASQDCGLSLFERGKSYEIIAGAINNGQARPSDVADAGSYFDRADRYVTSCEANLDAVATAAGLEKTATPSSPVPPRAPATTPANWNALSTYPASSTPYRTLENSTHCSAADAADNWASFWSSATACQSWLSHVRQQSAAGPTPGQVHQAKVMQCVRRQEASSGPIMDCEQMVTLEEEEANRRGAAEAARMATAP